MWNKTSIHRKLTDHERKILDDMLKFFENENITSQRDIEDLSSINDNEITYNYDCDCTGYYFWWAGIYLAVHKGNYMEEDIFVRIYFDDNYYDLTHNNKEIIESSFKCFDDVAKSLKEQIQILKNN